jgi:Zn-finger domain associated with topoisomerase type I
MTQAARSGKANITEGSARAATSKETEMKLTDVARASLAELRGDYEDWLLRHNQAPWAKDSPEAQTIASLRLDPPEFGEDYLRGSCLHLLAQSKRFARWLESDDPFAAANALIIIITRAMRTLERQLDAQGEAFEKQGGFREQLTAARTETRAKEESAPLCPDCGKPMHKRTAKTGKNAGNDFWGCTGYPDCKKTINIE